MAAIVDAKKELEKYFSAWDVTDFASYVNYVNTLCKGEVALFRGQGVDKARIPKIGRIKFRSTKSLSENEKALFNEFKRLSVPHLTKYFPKNDWEWLFIAQHYGLPTRLLDCTNLQGILSRATPKMLTQLFPNIRNFLLKNFCLRNCVIWCAFSV